MLEAAIGLSTALVTGMAVLTQRLHNRINELDARVDQVSLTLAQEYVSKQDLNEMMQRIEGQMIRIEDKLDRIVEGSNANKQRRAIFNL